MFRNNGYNAPVLDNSLKFKANIVNKSVEMKWEAFSKDEKFKYYKVVKSSTNPSPVYPDDGYIKYISNINETSYTDHKLSDGVAYYRVCAITHDKNRYCSNVVKVFNENTYVCTAEYSPVCGYKNGRYKTYSNKCMLKVDNATKKYYGKCRTNGEISNSSLPYRLKIKGKKMVNAFVMKLEKKGYSNEKKAKVIEMVIDKLNLLKTKKPKLKEMVNYLVKLLNEKKAKYEDDFSELEKIFEIE
ncbi:hypothetical protein CSA08_01950 [Candidatus Gracilibacteria bacterium]|nr:MAG: hypothetical protein CSA08_01950 [Candidatus Gracilibacteria bacterium]